MFQTFPLYNHEFTQTQKLKEKKEGENFIFVSGFRFLQTHQEKSRNIKTHNSFFNKKHKKKSLFLFFVFCKIREI